MATKESHTREGDMAADTPQDMSLEQQKLVRTLVKALDAIGTRLRRVPLDEKKSMSRVDGHPARSSCDCQCQ
jgi:hypothetical protein